MDINVTSQLVVQTAAQWAVDATVYSDKRILITSDVLYTGTDQRKIKISNGTDAWANLDYFPAGGNETLAQTLALGNTTSGNDIILSTVNDVIKSPSATGHAILLDDTYMTLSTDNGAYLTPYATLDKTKVVLASLGSSEIRLDGNSINLTHATLIKFLNSPVRFDALTATTVPYLDASKNLVSSAVTPTQLSYLDATSSIQTQINLANIFAIPFSVPVVTVADATSYYFSLHYGVALSTVETRHQFQIGYACQVIGAVFGVSDNTTTGTTEASTLKIRNITQATSTTIGGGAVYTNGTGTTTVMTTLTGGSVAVAATDYIAIELLTAAFVTNPTSFKIEGWLYLKRV